MTDAVTIGQAAAFVGVTVKTVRHYHKLGLIDEPRRDSSGYRRYDSAALLRLIQIRTLAAAGVPLSEIVPMLDADPERFESALTDVEQRLDDRITELTARRDMLRRLADDRALLPDRALAILDRMSDLGFRPDYVAGQREALVLTRALVPAGFDDFLTNLERRLDDPRYVELTKRACDAANWDPDDPRVEELATAIAEHYLANPTLLGDPTGRQGRIDPIRYGLINHHTEELLPISARLTALTEAKLRAAGVPVPHQ